MFTDDGILGPYAGFGLDVPFTDAQGSLKTAHAGTGSNCSSDGNALALQSMLSDLGFYKGKLDGIMGSGTRDAVKAFAAAHGIDAGPFFSTGSICQAIMDAWQAKKAGAAAPAKAPPNPTTKPVIFVSPAILAAMGKKAPASPGAAAAAAAGSGSGIAGWWASLPTSSKLFVVGGVLGVAGIALYAVGVSKRSAAPSPAPATMTPNQRRRRPTSVKTCRTKPPKGYPKKRSAYALPECWMYPLTTKQRVRTAASRFGKYKKRYSAAVQKKVAERIDRAKRRFHVGEYHR